MVAASIRDSSPVIPMIREPVCIPMPALMIGNPLAILCTFSSRTAFCICMAARNASSAFSGKIAIIESPRYWLINPLFDLMIGPSLALNEDTKWKFSSGVIFSERVVKSLISVNNTVTIFSTWSPSFTSVITSLPKERMNSFGTNFFVTSWMRKMASSLSFTSRMFLSYNIALSMAADDWRARVTINFKCAAENWSIFFPASMIAPMMRCFTFMAAYMSDWTLLSMIPFSRSMEKSFMISDCPLNAILKRREVFFLIFSLLKSNSPAWAGISNWPVSSFHKTIMPPSEAIECIPCSNVIRAMASGSIVSANFSEKLKMTLISW